MKLPEPFYPWHEHMAVELPGAQAVFTTRRGGFSEGPYASLNLGKLTPDDPAAVQRNRNRLQSQLGGRMAMIRQVHGSRVLRLGGPEGVSGPAPDRDLEEADGQATASPAVAPIVLTADCLPVIIAGGGALAVLHAGWRGLVDGVIREGVRAVRELAPDGQAPAAAIGPGAGVCCYEVGPEIHERFGSYHGEVHRGKHLDLKAVARTQLIDEGVSEIHDVGLCTICSPPGWFFSHRRDRGVTGRQAGVAWLS